MSHGDLLLLLGVLSIGVALLGILIGAILFGIKKKKLDDGRYELYGY